VECERWQEAISASVDGERAGGGPAIEARLIEAHLAHCGACREFRDLAERSRRAMRLHVAGPMPDLSPRIVKMNAVADRASRWGAARAVLAVVALEIVVFSLPALVLGDEKNTSAHAARHLGAFTVAYGVGLLVVVVRPARARAVLPVAMVLAGALSITALIDLISGHVPLVGEAQHLPELISVVLVWYLATPTPRRTGWLGRLGRAAPAEAATGALRVVDERDAG
jgi:predicted anti-sigma-YlaC factor YlaD